MPVGRDGIAPARVCVCLRPTVYRSVRCSARCISAFVDPLCAACLCCRELISTSTLTRIERCCFSNRVWTTGVVTEARAASLLGKVAKPLKINVSRGRSTQFLQTYPTPSRSMVALVEDVLPKRDTSRLVRRCVDRKCRRTTHSKRSVGP
jgi:hypothetical protein